MKKWEKTGHKGIEFRKHDTRKHGLRLDRYFRGRIQVDGVRKTIGLGWESEGMTETAAVLKLAEFKANMVSGKGPTTKAEERAAARAALEQERLKAEQDAAANIFISNFWNETYFPKATADTKKNSWRREEQLFRLWVAPVIGGKRLSEVAPSDLERIKLNMTTAKRAPRTINYALQVVRHIYTVAEQVGQFAGKSPIKNVKFPRKDNARKRFLTHEQADELLAELKKRSTNLHDLALVSLRTGLRFGEISALSWADIDFDRGQILVRDPKSVHDRWVFMTDEVRTALERQRQKTPPSPMDRVFLNQRGAPLDRTPQAFFDVVNCLGLNNGITDNRLKLVFHSLRHSFASQLVESGADLFTVMELLGHKSIIMTQRYSHLAPGTLRRAVAQLNAAAQAARSRGKLIPFDRAAGAEE